MCEGYIVRLLTIQHKARIASHSRAQKTPATVVIRPINVLNCFRIVLFFTFHQTKLRELYRKCSALYWSFTVILFL